MNKTKKQILKSMYSVIKVLNDTEFEQSVMLLCEDCESVIIAEFEKIDESVQEINLKVKAEDATDFEDVMNANGFDLSNPEIDQDSWFDVHELWIQFRFYCIDDELLFQEVINELLH